MSGILIVEDEALIAAQVREQLESMGYAVAGAVLSGEEAVSAARALSPDLVLMDIMLGNGRMDGISAAQAIHERQDVPVVFLTAFGSEKILSRAKTVDPAGFLTKPFSEQDLKATIELALYRRGRERELKSSEERYRSVVSTAVEAILIIDTRMRIVLWNRAAAGMFGWDAEEVKGRPFLHLIPERCRPELGVEMDRMVLTEEKNPVARTTETAGRRKDGSEFPMEFSLSSWILNDEIFFTINARDITDRKKIEQMKSDFVSLVSHQLKTPVAGVLGCLDNLMNGLAGPVTREQMEYYRIMRDISLRNYRNISDLLNVSRIERGVVDANLRPVPLKAVVAGVLRDHREGLRAKGLALRLSGWGDRPTVLADRDKLYEAVSNVVHNAVKFTERGALSVRLGREGEFATVEVEDTGPGIPYEIQNHLFKKDMILRGAPDPNRGSGLGLYLAREFLRLQNGDVSAVSVPGQGSRFTFRVPLDTPH